jgi:hypothetical protein
MRQPRGIDVQDALTVECHTCHATTWLPPGGLPPGWSWKRMPDYLDLYFCNLHGGDQ